MHLSVVSPDLSAAENIKIGTASKCCFDDLITLYMKQTPREKRGLVAALGLCCYLFNSSINEVDDYISRVLPFFEPAMYTFHFSNFVHGREVLRTKRATVLEHLCTIWVEDLFQVHSTGALQIAQALVLLETTLDLDNSPYIDLWCVCLPQQTPPTILPNPKIDMQTLKQEFSGYFIFGLRLWPKDIIRPALCPVQVMKYKVPDQEQFVELDEAMQQRFRASTSWKDADIDYCLKEIDLKSGEVDDTTDPGWVLHHLSEALSWWSGAFLPTVDVTQQQDLSPCSEEDSKNLRTKLWQRIDISQLPLLLSPAQARRWH